LSKGAAKISFDSNFAVDRPSDRARHVGDGLLKGAKALGGGVVSGIAGVVTQPLKGAREEGVGGFFKGVGKGLVGIAAKPLSGVLSLASKTSEGIQNSARHFLDGAAAARKRPPRVILNGRVGAFDADAAFGQLVMSKMDGGRWAEEAFVRHFETSNGTLVLTKRRAFLVTGRRAETVEWSVALRGAGAPPLL
jgi:vacuolar protein sorting-associated protein 13A/C